MTAVRMRRVGTRHVWVDPGEVAAVRLAPSGQQVLLYLASGLELPVVHFQDLEGRQSLTRDDVDKVVHQLTAKPT